MSLLHSSYSSANDDPTAALAGDYFAAVSCEFALAGPDERYVDDIASTMLMRWASKHSDVLCTADLL
jgi:hypothetical protein